MGIDWGASVMLALVAYMQDLKARGTSLRVSWKLLGRHKVLSFSLVATFVGLASGLGCGRAGSSAPVGEATGSATQAEYVSAQDELEEACRVGDDWVAGRPKDARKLCTDGDERSAASVLHTALKGGENPHGYGQELPEYRRVLELSCNPEVVRFVHERLAEFCIGIGFEDEALKHIGWWLVLSQRQEDIVQTKKLLQNILFKGMRARIISSPRSRSFPTYTKEELKSQQDVP